MSGFNLFLSSLSIGAFGAYIGFRLALRQHSKGPVLDRTTLNVSVDWDLIRCALEGSGYVVVPKDTAVRAELKH